MSDPKFHQHGGAHAAEHPPHGPYWKRMHHTPFFWVAAFFILLAMVIFIVTDGFSIMPGRHSPKPVPTLTP